VALALLLVALASSQADEELRARAARIHRDAIVLDTHADLTPFIMIDTKPPEITDPGMSGPFYDPAEDLRHQPIRSAWMMGLPSEPWDFRARHDEGYMDLPRLQDGGVDAQFFAVYMDREPRPGMAITRALRQIDSIHALADKHPEIALATTAEGVRAAAKAGLIAALIGVEGGYMIEDDIRVLRMFHKLGVRYMSLTHSFNTHWADSSGTGRPVPPRHEGLSPFGTEVVKEMNRLGMVVDVSHVADTTFFDAVGVSEAPVMASHSSVDGVKDHARNMSDEMLRALARNGGVIQINAVIKYIDPLDRGDDTPISVFIDHVAHAIEVAGEDHVGLGLDYGYDSPAPKDLEHIGKLGNVTYELLKRGYSEETIRKVLGENTLRVMTEAENVARRLAQAP